MLIKRPAMSGTFGANLAHTGRSASRPSDAGHRGLVNPGAMAEHRAVGYTLKKRYQVLARTRFQVLGKPNHPIRGSGVAG